MKFLFTLFCLLSSLLHAESSLSDFIHYNPKGPNPIGYLTIDNEQGINQSTFIYVKFALEKFEEMKVPFVLLRLNTPGGEVLSALKIAEALQKLDQQKGIPVIAFIDHWAISAGAMLAYSSRFIGIVKTASMGAAEPVTVNKEGKMESASEKVNSVLRAEFASLAESYGRNPLIAQAMVDKDMVLVEREGKVVELQEDSQIQPTDSIITRKGKLLTLKGEQLLHYKIADFMVPSSVFEEPFLAKIPDVSLFEYHDWRVSLFSFLAHPAVSSLLLIGLILGIYMEMNHPGFGVFGAIAIGCLSLLLLSSFALEAVNWIELIIFLAGVILLLVEIFVIPGFGFAGILGILLMVIGLIAMLLPGLDRLNGSWDTAAAALALGDLLYRLAWLCSALIFSLIAIALFSRYWLPKMPLFNRLIHKQEQEGYVAGIELQDLPPIHTRGIALTDMRPGGKVKIEEKIFDAMAEGGYVEKGRSVIIARLEGNKIIVREE